MQELAAHPVNPDRSVKLPEFCGESDIDKMSDHRREGQVTPLWTSQNLAQQQNSGRNGRVERIQPGGCSRS